MDCTSYVKIDSKWIIDISVKYKTVRQNLQHLRLGTEYLDMASNTYSIKEKCD